MDIKRRDVLIGLASAVPAAALMSRPLLGATDDDSEIMQVSKMLVGREDLNPDVGARILDVLSKRDENFADALANLAKSLEGQSDRDAWIKSLGEDETKTLMSIAQPWYSGHVGSPSAETYKDDAEFVTFFDAEVYRICGDDLPAPSLPVGKPGWWADPPPSVANVPEMPPEIRGWDYRPADLAPSMVEASDEMKAAIEAAMEKWDSFTQ